MQARILIVDDDLFLLENLAKLLASHGYAVETAANGEDGLRAIAGSVPELGVFDVSLPDFDGYTLCRRVRLEHRFPIVLLTARSESLDKVLGLDAGADDYLTKPFEPSELIARIRAHLRRVREYQSVSPGRPNAIQIGGLAIDTQTCEVILEGKSLALTKREYELLAHLASNAGRVVSRESLFERTWGFEMEFSSNSLDVHIYRLRQKMGVERERPEYIRTVRGFGYKIGAAD